MIRQVVWKWSAIFFIKKFKSAIKQTWYVDTRLPAGKIPSVNLNTNFRRNKMKYSCRISVKTKANISGFMYWWKFSPPTVSLREWIVLQFYAKRVSELIRNRVKWNVKHWNLAIEHNCIFNYGMDYILIINKTYMYLIFRYIKLQ